MDLLSSFTANFGRLVNLPMSVLETLLSHYFLLIFCGGLIFFVANTPSDAIFKVFDAFLAGNFAGAVDAIVDASLIFAHNVQSKFNGAAMSKVLVNSICKIMDFSGLKHCK